jgi:MarR family transcriptional regulator, organic hydroperoxide resistance regulator
LTERGAQIVELSATLARVSAMVSRKGDVDALAHQVEAESELGEFLAAANEGAANLPFGRAYKPILDAVGLTYTQYIAMVALSEQNEQTLTRSARSCSWNPTR